MSKYKITPELLDKVKILYTDCDVFKSEIKSDFIGIRRFLGKSKYYRDDKLTFEIDNTSIEYLHVAEAILETNNLNF